MDERAARGPGRPAPRRLGVAVIGMGWMGSVHARCYRQVPQRFPELGIDPQLVVCADNVAARAQEGAARAGFERATTDWRQAVADPQVDAVNIATQNALHAPVALAAIAAGKHVFCEKPAGRTPAETAAIAAAARAAGTISGVGYNYRWAPVVQYALNLVRAGRLGTVTHVRGRFLAGYASDPHGVLSWRFDREQSGGGAVADLMSHVADLGHALAGPVERLAANRHTFITERPLPAPGEGTHFTVRRGGPAGPVTNEDYGSALVRFAGGAQGTYEVCRVINGAKCQIAFEVNGTDGAIGWDFERMNELQLYLPDGTPERDGPVLVKAGPEHPFFANFNPGPALAMGYEDLKVIEAAQFAKSVIERKQGEPGLAEADRVGQVLAAFDRSVDSGAWETVAPAAGGRR